MSLFLSSIINSCASDRPQRVCYLKKVRLDMRPAVFVVLRLLTEKKGVYLLKSEAPAFTVEKLPCYGLTIQISRRQQQRKEIHPRPTAIL